MSILARYRKRGGLRQLLELIESSASEKQSKLLDVIAKEDPHMADVVREKILTADKVFSWDPNNICICLEEIPLQYRSIICKVMPDELWEKLRPIFKIQDLRELEEQMASSSDPLAGEVVAAKAALFARIRVLDEERVIVLSSLDPSLRIDEAA